MLTMLREEIVDNLELIKSDFRNFLYIAWKHLALPPPTPIQYDIAEYLQNGPKRLIIQAFRGVCKSWITSAFVVWKLLVDPQLNITAAHEIAERLEKTMDEEITRPVNITVHVEPDVPELRK